MAISKGFELLVLDNTDQVMANLGTVTFPALNWLQNMSSRSVNVDDNDYTYFADYTRDYGAIGNAVSDWYTEEEFSRFYTLAPMTLRRLSSQYEGYRVKLGGNTSGYYAISQNGLSAQGHISGQWLLYDNNDTLLGTSSAGIGFPLSNSTGLSCLMPHDIVNGIISSTTASALSIRFSNRTTRDATCSISGVSINQPFVNWYNALAQTKEHIDPFDPDGETGPGGGDGDFDDTSDPIPIPPLPSASAVDTGFITLFNPTAGQLRNLANYMWSSGFDLDTFKKLFADPMDCILGLSLVPVYVPNGGTSAVSVGNISTGVNMTKAASQYVEVDCGTLNINEYWGAYLDYDPYTKAEIYLPYIGTHPLSVDDIMTKPVHVVYHVDILSGGCTAFVQCGESVLYEFIGQCAASIPISGNDWTNVINGVISISGAIGSMVATGGATAPLAIGAIASTVTNDLKPNVEKSGSMSGAGGMLGVQTPYLIITRPRQAVPGAQNTFLGYPSFINESLGDLSGYTELDSIHLQGIPATREELSEIENILKGGVIF